MLTYIYLCFMFTTLTYLNAIPVSSINLESDHNNRLLDAILLERLGLGSTYHLTHPQYENDYLVDDELLHGKRDIEKKWAKFQAGRAGYTIAFPALIRTRR
ncbi:unnamed protein product [Adineta ricciae]|uniref:Uncharacterized protein n=1 Tax=Adineta ricciae TaxID=249248 RepID=A0A815MAN4_ADIRI|nr:unnamed protein product [Adineta ricciae]CAF1421516.1 unnamed protein product [Adineta ricciae]